MASPLYKSLVDATRAHEARRVMDQLYHAAKVIQQTPHIREHLMRNDAMAWNQINFAIREYERSMK